ncbi:MAG: DUF1501 domain-containing protein [Acidobacteria bacterium]|nr:DUF1501 domain-containing protein [Acidobacteriota bacterium]MCI0722279.1 DUF1501 domain-containing protein [Acidobacteriota bacterium]
MKKEPHCSSESIPFWMNRREFLGQMSNGLTGIALVMLLKEQGLLAQDPPPLGQTHFPPKAKRVIQIFCPGGVSQVDTFDYKPELQRRSGEPLPGEEKSVSATSSNGNLMKSPWSFRQRGQSGQWVSDLLPQLGEWVDDMAFIHSLTAKSNQHGQGCCQMNTGFTTEGYPSMGAWISYALGTENHNLPFFVAIPDIRGLPTSGGVNWGSGFLPAQHQGVSFSAAQPIRNLVRPAAISESAEADSRNLLQLLNQGYEIDHPGNSELGGRVAAYELAARMQLSAPEATDLSKETKATRDLYGADDSNPLLAAYARNCLLARRLIERGVRFVQLFCGARSSSVSGLLDWDAHNTVKQDYERHCAILDRPTASLIKDLKTRGLLEDTLVLWTTEFGRMPIHQAGTLGRDHNADGFTVWMLGAGVKGGTSYGATDDFGRRAVKDVCTIYDFHASVLHLLGLDHEKLTFYHNGKKNRLTDVHGHVIQELVTN